MGVAAGYPAFARKGSVIRIGVIGLDTSHSIAFTKIFHDPANTEFADFKVTVAFPYGSSTIESSYSRIPGYTEEIRKLGVDVVDSLDDLLKRCDVVLLETNDGNMHLEQASRVLKTGKRMFIDKPLAGNLKDAVAIAKAAEKYKNPTWSSSSLRFAKGVQAAKNIDNIGAHTGVDTFGPANLEPSHTDLAWYGIHGVETLFTVMGTGCRQVSRIHTPETDLVVGKWSDNRIGTYRGVRDSYRGDGGRVYGKDGVHEFNAGGGYKPLLVEVAKFFKTGVPPVKMEETLEIFAFMEAADESKKLGGAPVDMVPFLAMAK